MNDTFRGGRAAGSAASFGGKATTDGKLQATGITNNRAGGAEQAYGQARDAVSDAASKTGDAVGGGDYDALRADVSKLSQTVSNLVQNQASSISEQVKNVAGVASDNLSQAATATQDTLASMQTDLEGRVRSNPLAAVAIAVTAGFFLAKLI